SRDCGDSLLHDRVDVRATSASGLPRRARQANPRQSLRRLPRHQSGALRLHARGLAHRHAHDAQFRRARAKDEVDTLTQYLIKNSPERRRPAAVVIPGPVEAKIELWPVPTPGSRPHDPLATRDGAIWYTGQLSNKLGRLDPKTGAIKEYPLKTPQTGPH